VAAALAGRRADHAIRPGASSMVAARNCMALAGLVQLGRTLALRFTP